MTPPLRPIILMILLIGNYPLDRQQSMQRFATMMLEGLTAAGIPAEVIYPRPFFGRFRSAGSFIAKWRWLEVSTTSQTWLTCPVNMQLSSR